jgi:Tol biopolymer transport system component
MKVSADSSPARPQASEAPGTKRWSVRAIAAAIMLVIAGLSAPPALATMPEPNGRISFMRQDDNGFWQVWTSNPDLTADQQLTGSSANSGWPGWSPDASRIAFDSDRTDPNLSDDVVINDVFSMRADGSDVTKLTDSVGFSGDAAYSPDGLLIAFDADRGVAAALSIYVMNAADGSAVRRITTPPAGSFDSEPRFSPNGSAIVFTRYRGGHTLRFGRVVGDTSALFVVTLDGAELRRITGWGTRVGQADWSPDGSLIVFEDDGDYLGNADVYTVGPDGGGLAKLTHGHGITGIGNDNAFQFDGFYDPVWSPDGTKVLLGHEFLEDDGSFRQGLALIDPDGSNLDWVALEVHAEHQPDWGTAPLQ